VNFKTNAYHKENKSSFWVTELGLEGETTLDKWDREEMTLD
jgi:hypothetical protein